ncbi:MAG: gliding motility-associated C-terminal domain-containing protein, partial [Bacteroidota bacterium]
VFLDPDETVTITESICVLSCVEDRSSQYTAAWGCNGRNCNSASATDFIRIGEGSANAGFFPAGSVMEQDAGYCQTGLSVVTFSNDGAEADAGFGTMLNIASGIGMGSTISGTDSFALEDEGFRITSLRIAGVNIPSPRYLIELDSNMLFTTDPDGPGGLTDFDGDGYFDDLPINESIELIVEFEFDCSIAAELGADSTCANNFNTQLSALISYTDACDDLNYIPQIAYYANANSRDFFENATDPDAVVEQDTFYITHNFGRSVRFFGRDCAGNETFEVSVVLPPGVSPVISETQLLRDVTSVPLIGSSTNNDTLFLSFDASSLPFLQGEYDLILAFEADCSAPLGPTQFPMDFAVYCPPCDCRHLWYCGVLDGPILHGNPILCPPACPEGVRTYAFDVERTTFGFTDNTYSVPYGKDSANVKAAISCDSVAMRVFSVVGDSPVGDSIGVVVSYDNADESVSPDEIFLFDYAEVRITNAGIEYNCIVDNSYATVTAVDEKKTIRVDLHDCLLGLGITLAPGDTLDCTLHTAINPDGPYLVNFREVPNFRGYAYQSIDGVEVACDNFGDVFTIAKNRTVFDFPSSLNFPQGCRETFMNYRLVTTNNDYNKYFGNEFRQTLRVDSIAFAYDPAIVDAFSVVELQVTIQDHPFFGNDYFDVGQLDASGTFVARFDTLVQVPYLQSGQSIPFNMRLRLIPNCKSEVSSGSGNNNYVFDPSIYFIDRHYASFIGDGSCAEQIVETRNGDFFYSDPPTFDFVPISNSSVFLKGDTAEWVLRHCNNSFTADAGLTWLAIEDTSGALEIVSIIDESDPNNPNELTVEAYGSVGSNYFAITPGLLRGNGLTSTMDRCNTLRVRAVVRECGTTNFQARVGWNCTPFSDPAWTPELYPPCVDNSTDLLVRTEGAFLEANIIEQPATDVNLCDTLQVAIRIQNDDVGNAFDIGTNLILPIDGAEIVSGSVEMAYPSGAAFVPATSDPVFSGTNSNGRIFRYDNFAPLNTYLDQYGLPGSTTSADSNEFIIRYRVVTDCDFVSGSILYYNIKGLLNCGDSTNLETGETLPIIIQGANPGSSKLFDIDFVGSPQLQPGTQSTLNVTAINRTSLPTDGTTDKIRLRLPLEIAYIDGSSVGIHPSWADAEPEKDTSGGYQYLYWCMPAGIGQNDSAAISLMLDVPPLDCDLLNVPVELVTITRNRVACSSTGTDCIINAITATNNGHLIDLPVVQDVLDFRFNSITSACQISGEELLTVDGSIVNLGANDVGNLPITIRYYHDQNGSNRYEDGEPELINFVENGPIPAGGSMPFTHSFSVAPDEICAIVVLVDSMGLDLCSSTDTALGIPQLINAGGDELHCSNTPININTQLGEGACGAMIGYTYNWTAIAPASTADLSATNIPDPTLNVAHPGNVNDTLMYVLETSRPFCTQPSRDTVRIIRGTFAEIDPGNTIFAAPGESITLMPMVSGGIAPFTYSWTPAASLSDSTILNPVAMPLTDTDYILTVETGTGCSSSDTIRVRINPISVTVNAPDTIICEGSSLQLEANGAASFEWIANGSNPPNGGLDATDIANPVFLGGIGGFVYQYQVVGFDGIDPSLTDTADVRITVLPAPAVLTPIGDTTNCAGDTIAIAIQISQTIDSFWIEGSGGFANEQIIGGNTLVFDAIYTGSPSTFNVTFRGTLNACTITESFQIMDCVDVCTNPTVNSLILQEATCGNEDGVITIHLLEDESNYQYNWTPDLGNIVGAGNSRIDLPFGAYQIEIIDLSDGSCRTSIEVALQNSDGPQATATTTAATCRLADGTASLDPAGFTYDWPDGQAGAVRTDLQAGTYFVTLSDPSAADCPNVLEVLIEEDSPLTATTTVNTAPDCNQANGSVEIEVMGGSGDYTFEWGDGLVSTDSVRTGLAGGVHLVTITDNDPSGCQLTYTFALNNANPSATVTPIDTIDVRCPGGADGAYQYTVAYDPSFSGPADTIITNGIDTFPADALPAGTYCLMIVDANNCIAGSSCFDIAEPDSILLHFVLTPACNSDATIDLSVIGGTAPFTYDWADLMGNDDPQDRADLDFGTYAVTVTDANGCVAIEDELLTPSCQDSCDYFEGLDSISIASDTCGGLGLLCIDIPLADAGGYTLNIDGQVYGDTLMECRFETTTFYSYAAIFGAGNSGPYQVNSWVINGQVLTGAVNNMTELLDSMLLWDPSGNWQLDTTVQTFSGGNTNNNYGPLVVEANGFGISDTLIQTNSTVAQGFSVQLPEGAYPVIVTSLGNGCADTLFTTVFCEEPDYVVIDTVLIGQDSIHCIDTSLISLHGPIVSIENICDSLSDGNVAFLIDSVDNCVRYVGLSPGTDTACIVVCDVANNCDTIPFYITTLTRSTITSDSICGNTVFINQTKDLCIDTTQLPGNIVSISNACEELSGVFVEFFLDPVDYCISFEGLELGADTACIVLCDDLGLCDTTIYCVEVVEYLEPPVAVNDSALTCIGIPVVIDIKSNDTLFGGLTDVYILDPPLYGTIGAPGAPNQVNLDCSVTYNASEEFCERYDSFTYVVCTPNGCDTATVVVWLKCIDIVIFNAVSANGDGINDVFFISGIDEFPDNHLEIYNRWGVKVYDTDGYMNEWDGEWNGKDLPDGTYYYLLELNDDLRRTFKGYLELYR